MDLVPLPEKTFCTVEFVVFLFLSSVNDWN